MGGSSRSGAVEEGTLQDLEEEAEAVVKEKRTAVVSRNLTPHQHKQQQQQKHRSQSLHSSSDPNLLAHSSSGRTKVEGKTVPTATQQVCVCACV